MSRHIVLDSSPLGLLALPAKSVEGTAITQWSEACIAAGHAIYLPEIIDYELRRELLRAAKAKSLSELDNLKLIFEYLPITTDVMLRSAALWAESRRRGEPTSDPKKLDIDVILASQALTLPVNKSEIVVATSNVGHISRFVSAALWSDISP